VKIVREHIIFEKFEEDSDPVHDLGIGIKESIKYHWDQLQKLISKEQNNIAGLRSFILVDGDYLLVCFVNVEEDITYVQRIVNRIKKIVEKSEITKYVKYSYFRHQLSVTNIMVFFSINPRYISYFKNLQ